MPEDSSPPPNSGQAPEQAAGVDIRRETPTQEGAAQESVADALEGLSSAVAGLARQEGIELPETTPEAEKTAAKPQLSEAEGAVDVQSLDKRIRNIENTLENLSQETEARDQLKQQVEELAARLQTVGDRLSQLESRIPKDLESKFDSLMYEQRKLHELVQHSIETLLESPAAAPATPAAPPATEAPPSASAAEAKQAEPTDEAGREITMRARLQTINKKGSGLQHSQWSKAFFIADHGMTEEEYNSMNAAQRQEKARELLQMPRPETKLGEAPAPTQAAAETVGRGGIMRRIANKIFGRREQAPSPPPAAPEATLTSEQRIPTSDRFLQQILDESGRTTREVKIAKRWGKIMGTGIIAAIVLTNNPELIPQGMQLATSAGQEAGRLFSQIPWSEISQTFSNIHIDLPSWNEFTQNAGTYFNDIWNNISAYATPIIDKYIDPKMYGSFLGALATYGAGKTVLRGGIKTVGAVGHAGASALSRIRGPRQPQP